MVYDAVLLDFDGTLVEVPSRERLRDAVIRACRRTGIDAAVRETVQALRAGDTDTLVERCRAAGADLDSFRVAAAGAVVGTQLRTVEAGLRSVYRDVTALSVLDCPLGIVSNNHPRALAHLLERFGLDEQFAVVRGCPFTPEGFARRKPAPDNIEAAMDDLGATSALYVGDQSIDVAAASNAGIESALIERDGFPPVDPTVEEGPPSEDPAVGEATSPTYRLSSLAELPDVASQ